jgi:hypothetical protein
MAAVIREGQIPPEPIALSGFLQFELSVLDQTIKKVDSFSDGRTIGVRSNRS